MRRVRPSPCIASRCTPAGRARRAALALAASLLLATWVTVDAAPSDVAPADTTLAGATTAHGGFLAAPGVRLPAYRRDVLANGLVLCVMPRPHLPLVEMRLLLRGGSTEDPSGQEGLASLVARLLTRGTHARDPIRFAGDLAEIGASLDADAGAEDLTLRCSALAGGASAALVALAEAVRHPAFLPAEFAAALRDARGDIAAARDDPSTLADRALGRVLFGRDPLAHPRLGDESSLARIRRRDVVEWHARHARPDSAVLVIVGDVDTAEVWNEVTKAFGGWTPPTGGRAPGAGAPTPPPSLAPAPARVAEGSSRRIVIVPRSDITQAHVRFAEIACGRDTPDYAALQVANALLAEGYTSRLVREIRVARGLTYGIASRFAMFRQTGYFAISTSTHARALRALVRRTLDETARLLREGPEPEEVARAQSYLCGQYPPGLQAPEDLAEHLLDQEFYRLPSDDGETYLARVRAVTADDVRRVLHARVHPDRWTLLVVAPLAEARRALRGFGTVEVMSPP